MDSNSHVKVHTLGAGQEVGRSCVIVTLGSKRIMFDCGIHMLYLDHRRYPDFASLYSPPDTIDSAVDLVIITHFHLDHCGALPILTEQYGYSKPIYASTPTKAMLPFMLQDFRKVSVEQKKQQPSYYVYAQAEVASAASKVISLGLQESVIVDGMRITCYYAGHVLGASMFFVENEGFSVVYTGDYNSYADRHLGAACIPRLNPSVVITQTTYATTIRDSKREREREMLKLVRETVERGGKVLIPVFALGRAQELSVLLETYWQRTESNIPVYFSAGLIEKANIFYRLFVEWENERTREQFALGDNVFDFKKVRPFDKSLMRADTPCVLFATPGMLHGGTSMQVFKEWCADARNTLIIPGYCVEGTLGNRLLRGAKTIVIDRKTYDVNMTIKNLSFSAHADAKGIISLLRHLHPQSVVFVHGDKFKMEPFSRIVQEQLRVPVYMPANHITISIPVIPTTQLETQNQRLGHEGYLLKKQGKHIFIEEDRMMDELNEMMSLLGETNSILIHSSIDCLLRTRQCCESSTRQVKEQEQEIKGDIRQVAMKVRGTWRDN